ncbi:MAG: division/cell wall cluster transcriptional repressor MraZ [Proteobacteria bacterium]|nr:division/cell wall cluster transcriptional repressor MraZ [Pseudomonadota bacterium]MBU1737045.1 division/cell wall cluster transcriptional repressor MraZ [Pseudomonadota bacterium]
MIVTEERLVKNPVHHFRGRSDHTLDGKGRINIPTRFREVLRLQFNNERLMVFPWRNCLKAYPLSRWEELELSLLATGKKHPETIKMVRFMVGGVVECPVDKQGRILLPAKMRADCGISKEVLVSGMISYFEIWDSVTWEKENLPAEEDFKGFELNQLESGFF